MDSPGSQPWARPNIPESPAPALDTSATPTPTPGGEGPQPAIQLSDLQPILSYSGPSVDLFSGMTGEALLCSQSSPTQSSLIRSRNSCRRETRRRARNSLLTISKVGKIVNHVEFLIFELLFYFRNCPKSSVPAGCVHVLDGSPVRPAWTFVPRVRSGRQGD